MNRKIVCMEKNTKLKIYLSDHGIKQSWIAEQTGMTQSWINKIVSGKSTPKVHHAIKIAKTLGVRVEELWGEDE